MKMQKMFSRPAERVCWFILCSRCVKKGFEFFWKKQIMNSFATPLLVRGKVLGRNSWFASSSLRRSLSRGNGLPDRFCGSALGWWSQGEIRMGPRSHWLGPEFSQASYLTIQILVEVSSKAVVGFRLGTSYVGQS